MVIFEKNKLEKAYCRRLSAEETQEALHPFKVQEANCFLSLQISNLC